MRILVSIVNIDCIGLNLTLPLAAHPFLIFQGINFFIL